MKKTALALSVLMAVSMCGADVLAAHFTHEYVSLDVGDTQEIRLEDAQGKIKYTVTDSSVFRYDGSVITAVGDGTAYLYGENNGKKYRCIVTVNGGGNYTTSASSSGQKVRSYDVCVSCSVGKSVSVKNAPTYGKAVSVINISPDVCTVSVGLIEDGTFPIYISAKKKGVSYISVVDAATSQELFVIRAECGGATAGAENVSSISDKDYSEQYAQDIIDMVNEERAARGLNELEYSEELCKTAKIRAAEIGKKFSHTRPDGTAATTAVTISYTVFGENIAHKMDTPEKAMKAWMKSDRHRGNILNKKYNKIGVAYNKREKCWVQVFTD